MATGLQRDPSTGLVLRFHGSKLAGFGHDGSYNATLLDTAGTAQFGINTSGAFASSLAALTDFRMGSQTPGGATSLRTMIFKKTGIADNSATAVLTVTVPNVNAAAAIKLTFLASLGSTDAFESSRVAEGLVVLARTAGANVVAAVATLELAQIGTVASGATLTLAYDLSSITGAVGATNTFDIRVTLNDSGGTGANQIVVLAELINAEAGGVTMAAAA